MILISFIYPIIFTFKVIIDAARLEKIRVTEPYGYIIKPFEDKELRTAIEMALQRHKREKAL